MKSSCSVIIVNYKNEEKTLVCVKSILDGTVVPNGIYIVDNASTSKSRVELKKLTQLTSKTNIQIISNPENRGFAVACNQGIVTSQKEGNYDFFWLLNNDTLVEKNALEELLSKAISSNAAITGSRILSVNGEFLGGIGYANPFFASVSRCSESTLSKELLNAGNYYIEGASMLISAKQISTIGLLPEDYFLYYEDSSYCLSAKRLGNIIAWASKSIVFHDIGSSTGSEKGKGNVPFFIDCLMVRNRILFARKNGFSILGTYLGLTVSLLLRFKRRQFGRVITIIKIIRSRRNFKNFIEKNGGYYE